VNEMHRHGYLPGLMPYRRAATLDQVSIEISAGREKTGHARHTSMYNAFRNPDGGWPKTESGIEFLRRMTRCDANQH
jgi:hypothetical protein